MKVLYLWNPLRAAQHRSKPRSQKTFLAQATVKWLGTMLESSIQHWNDQSQIHSAAAVEVKLSCSKVKQQCKVWLTNLTTSDICPTEHIS